MPFTCCDIRQYKIDNHCTDKLKFGERDGCELYLCFQHVDHYAQRQAPNGTRFSELTLGLDVSFAAVKGNVWTVWRPGWGVDIHYPIGVEPEYLKQCDANETCEYTGAGCKSDGSSLADHERLWPAFRTGGVSGAFAELCRWSNRSSHQ